MKYLNKTIEYILFAVLAAMSFSMAVNVVCRSLLSFSLSWADELSQALLVWLTFLGAAVAVREHLHYSFNYIQQLLKGKARICLMLLNDLTVLFCALYMFKDGIIVTKGISEWLMPAMGISRAWVYGACPVGCALMILYVLVDIVNNIKAFKA